MTEDTDTGRPVATMPGPPSASAKPAVEVVDLRRRYGSFEAAQGISFSVQPGEVLALLGVNGAGKTSALEVVEGLAPDDGGTVRILGHDPLLERAAVRRHLGVVPHNQLPSDCAEPGEGWAPGPSRREAQRPSGGRRSR